MQSLLVTVIIQHLVSLHLMTFTLFKGEAYYKGYGSCHFLSIFVFIMAFATFGYFVFHNRRKVSKTVHIAVMCDTT